MKQAIVNKQFHNIHSFTEAQKAAEVSRIQYEQKIMEKESTRKMSEIEGGCFTCSVHTGAD